MSYLWSTPSFLRGTGRSPMSEPLSIQRLQGEMESYGGLQVWDVFVSALIW